MGKKPKKISQSLMKAIEGREAEIVRAEYLLTCMRVELERVIETELHVNLRAGNWKLDRENNQLVYIDPYLPHPISEAERAKLLQQPTP